MPYTSKTWAQTMADLSETFEKWGVDEMDWSVDSGIKPHRAANINQTAYERTVSLTYTTREGNTVELTIDKWPRAIDNLRAIYLTVESLRLNEYRGIADAVRAAYAQLPAPATGLAVRDPYNVLGVAPGANMEVVEAIYKTLAKRKHPDAGGTREEWDELQSAIERIRKERRQQ